MYKRQELIQPTGVTVCPFKHSADDSPYFILMKTHKINNRFFNNPVKSHQYRKLYKQRQTAAHWVYLVFLIQLHCCLLYTSSTDRYKKADSYPNEIKLRDKGNFYLDIENKIAAVDTNASVNSDISAAGNYAYLVGAVMNDGFDDTAQLKLFTKTGETVIMNTTSKLRLNDDYGKTAEDVVKSLTTGTSGAIGQVIVFEANSNNAITAIAVSYTHLATTTYIDCCVPKIDTVCCILGSKKVSTALVIPFI